MGLDFIHAHTKRIGQHLTGFPAIVPPFTTKLGNIFEVLQPSIKFAPVVHLLVNPSPKLAGQRRHGIDAAG